MGKLQKRGALRVEPNEQTILQARLARMDGQVQALRRMVGNRDDWKKMLTLAAAIEGAADQVSADLFRGYLILLPINTKGSRTE